MNLYNFTKESYLCYKCFWICLTIMTESSIALRKPPITDDWSVTEINIVRLNYTWTVSNFSTVCTKILNRMYFTSSTFASSEDLNVKWSLTMYPSGSTADVKDFVSLFLHYVAGHMNTITVSFKLSLLNDRYEMVNTAEYANQVMSKNTEYGALKFVKRDDVLNKTSRLLSDNDQLMIFVDISAYVGWVSYSGDCRSIGKEPNKNATNELSNFVDSEKFSDVVLMVQGKQMYAHKIILASQSPVFAALFDKDENGMAPSVVEIDDVDYNIMKEVLRYIYTTEIPQLKKLTKKLLFAANAFGMDSLKEICERELCKNLGVENAYEVFALADKHKADKLKTRVVKFMASHIFEMIASSSFKSLIDSNPNCIADALRLE